MNEVCTVMSGYLPLLLLLASAAAVDQPTVVTGDGGHGVSGDVTVTTNAPTRFVKRCKYGKVKKGDKIAVHYKAYLHPCSGLYADSKFGTTDCKFDDTWLKTSTHPINVHLGKSPVLPGWNVGLPGMCLAENRTLLIPPHLGYGADGVEGVVPPSSTLRFEVVLLEHNGRQSSQGKKLASLRSKKDAKLETDFTAFKAKESERAQRAKDTYQAEKKEYEQELQEEDAEL